MTYTTVQLSQTDATAFISFQKHYALIGLLESIDAFNVKNGSVTIHFDSIGNIGAVDKHMHYKQKLSTA